MNIVKAEILARRLIKEHNLEGWAFDFDRATRRFGLCNYRNMTISLSKKLTELNTEEKVRDTILHEIAHALLPRGTGHGLKWQLLCRKIGGDGKRLYSSKEVVMPKRKKRKEYITYCDLHGKGRRIYRVRKKLACRTCCILFNHGRFSYKYLLTWKPL